MKNLILFVLFFICSILTLHAQQKAQPVMLPNGWRLTPAGTQYPLGDLPLNIAITPNKHYLAVTNNGYGRQSIQVFNSKTGEMVADRTMKASWYGLTFSPNGKKLYASGGDHNYVLVFNFSRNGQLTLADSIVLGPKWPTRISPTGIACANKRNEFYVISRWQGQLFAFDATTDSLLYKMPLNGEGYDILVSPDDRYAYISLWSNKQVLVWNLENHEWEKPIEVGTHPNELCFDKSRKRLFVANAEDNTVSIVNLAERRVEETLNAAPYESQLEGSTTNGLAITSNGKTLAIANADNNCLTLFDISIPGQSRAIGFIPTGWYPTNVACIGKNFWVTNGKGLTSKPNPKGPQPDNRAQNYGEHMGNMNRNKRNNREQYIAGLFLGALSKIEVPKEKQLAHYTSQVFANTPYKKAEELNAKCEPGNPVPSKVGDPSPIKHVFYIIKENRTYDQVLGDMKQGNGDSTICLFPRFVTPNQHKLAEEFVLLDNFYVNAEVSCDGHNWTLGAYANDYLEKTWPSSYSGRGSVYSAEGYYPMGNNKSGFLWKNCLDNKVSFRCYGEFVHRLNNGTYVGNVKELNGHVCPDYLGWNLEILDTIRVHQWIHDFDSLVSINKVPQMNVIRMGGDHTRGMQLGKRTPYAYVADNDLAVGMFIEHLSHSPVWKESAVFIIEDDAQNGADHVDAHRSTAYVAGPFVKRGYVDSTPYTTTSMLRTMELILGLPPMTQHDASARPMWRSFTQEANYTPFTHLPANVNLSDVNKKESKWQAMSENFNFDKEDNVPDMEFNKVLWFGIKGDHIAYPPLRRSAFLSYSQEDDDDDD